MKVVSYTGKKGVAFVYIGEFANGKYVEFVESLQPPHPVEKKWVIIVSTLFGCPVKCKICDAGENYSGKLSTEEILAQIDYVVNKTFPDKVIPVEKFKIQFARMGEPAFNENVIEVLELLPKLYDAPGLIPSVSTIAPAGTEKFFEKLMDVKKRLYGNGKFQMQFSIHTTDEKLRDEIMPVRKWDFKTIAEFGDEFYQSGDRKITLNFPLAEQMPVDPDLLYKYFNPEKYLVKITPINPTYSAVKNRFSSYINPHADNKYSLVETLRSLQYEVIVSIGELEENKIGSNCGQYLKKHLAGEMQMSEGYTYQLQSLTKI